MRRLLHSIHTVTLLLLMTKLLLLLPLCVSAYTRRCSETGTDFGTDFVSKHAMHAGGAEEVLYAGGCPGLVHSSAHPVCCLKWCLALAVCSCCTSFAG